MKDQRDLDETILNKAYERGYYYEGAYRGCAQAVIAATSEFFDIDEAIFKIASGFSGGIADEAKNACGAFSGCVIIISYFFGREREQYEMSGSMFKYRELIKKIRKLFHETFKGETCPSVQECIFGTHYDMSDPHEKIEFEAAGAHKDKCTHVVGTATKWLVEILLQEGIPLKKSDKRS